jgi:hypothetical protein
MLLGHAGANPRVSREISIRKRMLGLADMLTELRPDDTEADQRPLEIRQRIAELYERDGLRTAAASMLAELKAEATKDKKRNAALIASSNKALKNIHENTLAASPSKKTAIAALTALLPLYVEEGATDAALRAYRRLKALGVDDIPDDTNSDFANLLAAKGNEIANESRFTDGKEYYDLAIQLDSNCSTAHLGLARLFEASCDEEGALGEYEKAFSGSGKASTEAGMRLAEIYLVTAPDKAERVVSKLAREHVVEDEFAGRVVEIENAVIDNSIQSASVRKLAELHRKSSELEQRRRAAEKTDEVSRREKKDAERESEIGRLKELIQKREGLAKRLGKQLRQARKIEVPSARARKLELIARRCNGRIEKLRSRLDRLEKEKTASAKQPKADRAKVMEDIDKDTA